MDVEDLYRVTCMPDGYCWLYSILLQAEWTEVHEDGTESLRAMEDVEALFEFAKTYFPPGLSESRLNWLLDSLNMPRFIDILEFLDGRHESDEARIPVRMFTDHEGSCHAYLISYKGRKFPRKGLNVLYASL